jgi:hypothetical protein
MTDGASWCPRFRKGRSLRTADLGVQRSMGASVCYGLNGRFCNSDTEPSQMQLRSGFLKVFRCGPGRNSGCQEMAARVDKPRKDEAAGAW